MRIVPSTKAAMENGDPGKTRTSDLRFRKPSLYPAELRDHGLRDAAEADAFLSDRPAFHQSGQKGARSIVMWDVLSHGG